MSYTFLDATATTRTADSSIISGTTQRPIVNVGSIIGNVETVITNTSVAVLQGTNPWQVNMPSPSVIAIQLAGSILATSATVETGNSSVQLVPSFTNIGSVAQAGNWVIQPASVQLISTSASVAVLVNRMLQGSASVLVNNILTGKSSVQLMAGTKNAGSITAIQGTNPWRVGDSSVQGVGLMPKQSVSGVGIFNVNHAVASFLGVDLTKRPLSGDSAGRIVAKPFAPEESRVEGHHSVNGVSVTALLPAAGTGLRNYVTDIMIANPGASDTIVKFTSGGGASVIGFTIAPTLGGSNVHFATPLRTKANETFDMTAGTATSTLYGTVTGFKAP